MTIQSLKYSTDYLFNIESLEKINEVIDTLNQDLLYSFEGSFTSEIIQSGSPVDVPQIVTYGANKNSDNDHLTYQDGILTVNTTGYYIFKTRQRASRSGASGVSQVYFWAEISLDGGSTWSISGSSIDVKLFNSNDSKIFFDTSAIYLPQGVKLRAMFSRSSTGDDSGDLIPSTPSALLQTYGVEVSPSAQLTVYKAQ